MPCEDLPILDIFSLSESELSGLGLVVSDSGVQGIATYSNVLPFLEIEVVPIGFTVDWYSEGTPPDGWLLCDGSSFSAVTYPELAQFLGGTTLPDFTGRSSEGAVINPNDVGTIQGEYEVTLSANNIPEHTHSYTDTIGVIPNPNLGDSSSGKFEGDDRYKPSLEPASFEKTTSSVGNADPVNNVQPTIIVNKLIKAG